jgi:Ser/Thr protein kinase RdoA (MazF antagonist)
MKVRARSLLAWIGLAALLAALPLSSASASKASLEAALNSYNAQLATAEADVASAVQAYKSSADATAVEAAIAEQLNVLRAIRTTVKAQKAGGHPLVRFGKTEVLAGLKSVMASWEHVSKEFADATTKPQAAKRQYELAIAADRRGLREIRRGERLL